MTGPDIATQSTKIIETVRVIDPVRGDTPCTACGHIIDWKGYCACDGEKYLGIRGGEKAEQTAIELHEAKCELHEAKCEIERLREIIADGGRLIERFQQWLADLKILR